MIDGLIPDFNDFRLSVAISDPSYMHNLEPLIVKFYNNKVKIGFDEFTGLSNSAAFSYGIPTTWTNISGLESTLRNHAILSDILYYFVLARSEITRPVLNKESIKARLQHPYLKYSPVTVDMVNNLSRFTSNQELRGFLQETTNLKWTKTRHDTYWSPYCLQTKRWNSGLSKYVREYFLKHHNFKAHLESWIRFDEPSRNENLLLNYTTRVTDHLSFIAKKQNTELFFGTELEYEGCTNKNIKDTHNLVKDYAIIKRDGSLQNGLEICTAPMCFDSHEKLKDFFTKLPEGLSAAPTTGMHVHISRNALSFLQLGKMFKLLNTQEYEDWIIKIAGRSKNRFCETDLVESPLSYPFLNGQHATRYRRVNLTNPHTIEIRMFSTPMTYDNYRMKLELCKALVDFSNPGTVGVKDVTLDKFKGFIVDNRKVYHNLAKEI